MEAHFCSEALELLTRVFSEVVVAEPSEDLASSARQVTQSINPEP
jgi:hypothetical protein